MRSVLFEVFGLQVHAYGFMLAIAFLVGIFGVSRAVKKEGIGTDTIIDLGTWILIGAVVGSRLAYVITEYRYFMTAPWWEVFMINSGGLAFHGGLIGGFLAGFGFIKIKKLHPWKLADVVAPYIALGYSLVRLGCFMNGCCYGKIAPSLPWAVRCSANDLMLRHPTQLYSALGSFILFLILIKLNNHRQFHGFLFLLYIGLYSILRFIVEIFRESPMVFPWLSLAQLVCIMMGTFAFGMIAFLEWRQHKTRTDVDGASRVQN